MWSSIWIVATAGASQSVTALAASIANGLQPANLMLLPSQDLNIVIITAQTLQHSFDSLLASNQTRDWAALDAADPDEADNIDDNDADTDDDSADSTPHRTELLHLSPDYADLFIQNKKDWANFQHYDYVHTVIEADGTAVDLPVATVEQSIHWVKIDLLQRYLSQYEWICWLDMDTIIVDINIQLQEYIKQAMRSRPQVDLIIEGAERYKKMDGTALKAGVIIMRNSAWTHQLLSRLKEVLADNDWQETVMAAMRVPSKSSLDNSLVFLLNSDHSADAHLYFMTLQDRWNQPLVYMPKIGILHFSGCTADSDECISVFNRAVDHMLMKEQMYVYIAAPYVQHIYNIFVGIYVLFALDRLYHIAGRFLFPDRRKKLVQAVFGKDDASYPMVVVQLPMFNEISCCETIIASTCKLDWPTSRLFIQVVDDSTSEETKRVINGFVELWSKTGVNIEVRRRPHRHGFKAGAMNEAMEHLPSDTEYIAIFDADFLPDPSFLRKSVPFLAGRPQSAFVQTCWVYTNAKESLLTRMQEISLNFHFLCEQEVRFRAGRFFNFNGTAGVWRLAALQDVGGWHTDTLVEDMDLSLRVYANGWDFIFLRDVKVLNEIPPTFDAYRGQQHRWTSGPMQVLKKAFRTVYMSDKLSFVDKIFCLWFFLRNYVHIINFLYFLILVPLMIWFPRVVLYEWAVIYLPAAISMSNIFFTPNEWLHVVPYVLFENAMCLYKTGALICGVLNIGKAKQWIVTPKFARKVASANDETVKISLDDPVQKEAVLSLEDGVLLPPPGTQSTLSFWKTALYKLEDSYQRINDWFTDMCIGLVFWLYSTVINFTFKVHRQEVIMSLFLLGCGCCGFLMRQPGIASFSLLNSAAYFILGIGWIGRSR